MWVPRCVSLCVCVSVYVCVAVYVCVCVCVRVCVCKCVFCIFFFHPPTHPLPLYSLSSMRSPFLDEYRRRGPQFDTVVAYATTGADLGAVCTLYREFRKGGEVGGGTGKHISRNSWMKAHMKGGIGRDRHVFEEEEDESGGGGGGGGVRNRCPVRFHGRRHGAAP